jgi:hypothetical protein
VLSTMHSPTVSRVTLPPLRVWRRAMHNALVPLQFHDTQFDIVGHAGERWLRLFSIGSALGYANPSMLVRIYQKHADEFTDRMTALADLPTAGGAQQSRIFSLRGAHLLAMFARTTRAAEFRRWLLDILDREVEGGAPDATKLAMHALRNGRWLLKIRDDMTASLERIPDAAIVATADDIQELLAKSGYLIVKRADVINLGETA